jgi:hypothetical protein
VSDLSRNKLIVLLLGVALTLATYFHGLDSLHIPKNGDEYVYAHILRLTAESGSLLPLQSELENMRNTKPPLIYWQGIASTSWGTEWEHWRLRWPSVIYTLLTAMMVFAFARKLGGLRTGFIAFFSFMAFMTTYRYGRPFLTDPPLVFWLTLPALALLYWREQLFESKLLFPVLAGLALGLGFLAKSFMLLVPVGLTLAWWYWRHRDYAVAPFLIRDSWKLVLMSVISLGLFSLWFVFDPDPQAILDEFIFKENVGKVAQENYWLKLIWGGSSIWSQAIGLLANTGLLIVPSAVLIYLAIRHRGSQSDEERMLWIWVIVYFVIFSLPTQRSARYLIPVMPAFAILLSLYWDRIPRWAFRVSLGLAVLFVLGIGFFSIKLETYLGETSIYPLYIWIILLLSLGAILFALIRSEWTRDLTPISLILVYFCLSGFFYPFDHAAGSFPEETRGKVAGKTVWVPYNFRAKYERYRFLLPGADIRGYHTRDRQTAEELMQQHDYVIIRHRADETFETGHCTSLGTRLEVRSRHNSREIREILLDNRMDHLFVREYLLHCPR